MKNQYRKQHIAHILQASSINILKKQLSWTTWPLNKYSLMPPLTPGLKYLCLDSGLSTSLEFHDLGLFGDHSGCVVSSHLGLDFSVSTRQCG